MSVVFFKAAFLFPRKSEDANYFALIWLPPCIYETMSNLFLMEESVRFPACKLRSGALHRTQRTILSSDIKTMGERKSKDKFLQIKKTSGRT